jgi:uncharacterized membrane protein YvbJ
MELGTFFVQLSLLLIIIMIVASHFFNAPYRSHHTLETTYSTISVQKKIQILLTQQEQLLERKAEIEADFVQGKMPNRYYQYAKEILRKDEEEILFLIQKIKAKAALDAEKPAFHLDKNESEELEVMISEYRKTNEEKMIGFCSKCGKPVQKSDVFCARCGFPLDQRSMK